MAIINKHSNGKGYLILKRNGVPDVRFKVDTDMVQYLLKNQDQVKYDSYYDVFKFKPKTGKNAGVETTLARHLYTKFRSKKQIKGTVHFKNGIKTDLRLQNLEVKHREVTGRSS